MFEEARKYIEEDEQKKKIFMYLYKFLPVVVAAAYLIILFTLWGYQDYRFARALEVPLFLVLGVTVLRKVINAKRPYEEDGFEPMIEKAKEGESFPSRHVASATIIAMAALQVNIATGIMLLLISILMGVMRVIAGVHHKEDVIAGFAISVVVGVMAFFI